MIHLCMMLENIVKRELNTLNLSREKFRRNKIQFEWICRAKTMRMLCMKPLIPFAWWDILMCEWTFISQWVLSAVLNFLFCRCDFKVSQSIKVSLVLLMIQLPRVVLVELLFYYSCAFLRWMIEDFLNEFLCLANGESFHSLRRY